MQDSFVNIFRQSLLSEADDLNISSPVDIDPKADKEAFDASLDKGTPKDAFDTPGIGNSGGQAEYVNTAKHWIEKLGHFSEELNGLDGNSLNAQLNEIDQEGSIFRGVVNDMSDDIVKVTELLRSMSETVKGYIISAKRKQRENDAQRNV